MATLYYAGDNRYGSWFVRVCGYGLQLKAPWNRALFSERYGYKKPFISYKGWRLFFLKDMVY